MGDNDPSIVYETKCWHAASRIFVSIHILSPRSLTSLYLRAIDMNCPRPYIHTTIVPDNNKESDSIIHRSGHKWWQPPISSSISIYFLLDLWRVYTCKPIIEFTHRLCGPLQHFFGKITSSKIICTHQLLCSLVNSLICDSHVNWMWQVPIEYKCKYKYIPSLTQAS